LTCSLAPLEDFRFDFPELSYLNSNLVKLSTWMLKRNRRFTLKFVGTATNTQSWNYSPDGTGSEHFVLTWSGSVTFRPTGCAENFFLAGTYRRRCYPG
jgi:hypothetical protein